MNITGEKKKSNQPKSSKILKSMIIIIILILLMTIGLIAYGILMDKNTLKISVDGKKISNINDDTFIINDEDVKIKIKDIPIFLKEYSFKNGKYGTSSQYTENKDNCYLQSMNEVVSYSQDSNIIEKVVLSETSTESKNNNELSYEEYDITTPVEIINNNLYTNLKGVSIGCNVQITYNKESNSIVIFTLDNLTQYYAAQIKQADITDENVLFSNKKAVLYGLIIVKDEQENYGVNDLNGDVIIGEKYKSIKFIEGSKEFIVETKEGTKGIIEITEENRSITKISPIYNSIEQIDDELYLVAINNKYGIINQKNQMIADVEYEKIGIDTNQLDKYNMKSGYIIYDKYIPVKKDKLWGFINKITGNYAIEPTYEEIGCITGGASENSAKNVILVPEYEGIIVKKGDKYGLINTAGKVIIQPGATEFYMINSNDQNEYYFVFNNEKVNLIEFLKQNNIQPVNETSTNINEEEKTETVQEPTN